MLTTDCMVAEVAEDKAAGGMGGGMGGMGGGMMAVEDELNLGAKKATAALSRK